MQNFKPRNSTGAINQRYSRPVEDKENYQSTKLDTRALKERLSIINNERKSLTRQSISQVTKQLEQTRSRHRMTRIINERESLPVKKEAILENLVSKLDAEEELRQILQKRYRNSIGSSVVMASRQSIASIKVDEPGSTAVGEYLVDKVRDYEQQILELKQLLMESQEKIRRMEQERAKHPIEAKRKTREKAIQTDHGSDQPNDFISNLEKTLQVLNNSGKYALY